MNEPEKETPIFVATYGDYCVSVYNAAPESPAEYRGVVVVQCDHTPVERMLGMGRELYRVGTLDPLHAMQRCRDWLNEWTGGDFRAWKFEASETLGAPVEGGGL